MLSFNTFYASDSGFSTQMVAEAYGGDEAEEINARTGCVGCNLASKDVALDALLKLPQTESLPPFIPNRTHNSEVRLMDRAFSTVSGGKSVVRIYTTKIIFVNIFN